MLRGCIGRFEVVCVEQIFISVITTGICVKSSVILINHRLEIVVFHFHLILVRLISITLLRMSVYAAAGVRWYTNLGAVSGASFD